MLKVTFNVKLYSDRYSKFINYMYDLSVILLRNMLLYNEYYSSPSIIL